MIAILIIFFFSLGIYASDNPNSAIDDNQELKALASGATASKTLYPYASGGESGSIDSYVATIPVEDGQEFPFVWGDMKLTWHGTAEGGYFDVTDFNEDVYSLALDGYGTLGQSDASKTYFYLDNAEVHTVVSVQSYGSVNIQYQDKTAGELAATTIYDSAFDVGLTLTANQQAVIDSILIE